MSKFIQTYLFKLYHYQKSLFWVVVFFVVGTLIATFSGNQSVPFWVYGMYSEKATDYTSGSSIQVFDQNGNIVPIYSQRGFKTRFFLHSPLLYYHQTQTMGEDPRKLFLKEKIPHLPEHFWDKVFINQPEKYGIWLKSYLNKISPSPIDSVYIVEVHYQIPFTINQTLAQDTLYVF